MRVTLRLMEISLTGVAVSLCLMLLPSPLAAGSIDASYVIGNLKEFSAGDSGVVRLGEEEMTFRAGKVAVAAPYKSVTDLEMGPAFTRPSSAPLWKRLASKRPVYRNITINFKDSDGDEQIMTLEMIEHDAAEVYDLVEIGSGLRRADATSQPWWGNNVWRTNRNRELWDGDSPVKQAEPETTGKVKPATAGTASSAAPGK